MLEPADVWLETDKTSGVWQLTYCILFHPYNSVNMFSVQNSRCESCVNLQPELEKSDQVVQTGPWHISVSSPQTCAACFKAQPLKMLEVDVEGQSLPLPPVKPQYYAGHSESYHQNRSFHLCLCPIPRTSHQYLPLWLTLQWGGGFPQTPPGRWSRLHFCG